MIAASVVIGSYPHTEPMKRRLVRSSLLDLTFIDVEPVHDAFDDMLRSQPFDICEMAIGAFFQAREAAKPVALLPVVTLARFNHGSLYYNPADGVLSPSELAGRRVAVRSYSQTTGLWARGVLAEQFGVALDDVTWVTTEQSHVAEYVDPPNVRPSKPGDSVTGLLERGEVDAAILAPGRPVAPWCVPLIADPAGAAQHWFDLHQMVPINHMVCVAPSIARDPMLVADAYDTFRRSYVSAGVGGETPTAITVDRDVITRTLAYALELARQQHLIMSELLVAELFAL